MKKEKDKMNLFELAYIQVLKEKRAGKTFKNPMLATLDRAIKIRHYLDEKEKQREKIKKTQFKKGD
jgi:hypothetical protein